MSCNETKKNSPTHSTSGYLSGETQNTTWMRCNIHMFIATLFPAARI